MKKFPRIFLLCFSFLCITATAFIYKADLFFSTSAISATWQSLTNLPYTLSHNVTVGSDSVSSSILIMGGIAGDSISSRILLYNASTAQYDTTLPRLPKRLMNGFGFKIKDSIYYGGGYTTNWKDTSMSADTLYDCVYPTVSSGYISGQKGKIYFTSNSGTNWVSRPLPDTTKNAVGISFVSDSVGFVILNRSDSITSSVYSTSNKGISWTAKLSSANLNDIFFQGANIGFLCGDNGSIKKTTNSGTNWTTINFGSDNYKAIYFLPNSATGFISGANGKIIKTTNSGTNWISQTTNTTKNLNSVVFSDSLMGYAVGDSGIILKTINGGTNWITQSSHTILNLRSIDKIDVNKLIASGDRGLIIYTTNGGTEWIQRVGVSSNRLNKVCIPPNDSIATAIGVKGWVVKANKPFFEYIINDTFYKISAGNLAAGWQTKASLPIPIAEVFSSTAVINDKIAFVMGGRTTGFNIADSVMRYNPLANVWSFGAHLPAKLAEPGAALIDKNKIMIAGGERSDSISNKVYIGTVDSNNAAGYIISWSTNATNFPIRSYAMGSKGFPSKKIAFFIGGNTTQFSFLDGPSGPSSKVYMYTSATDQFTELQIDIANPICHTGVDGYLGATPFTASIPDSSVRIFAPGGRDSNYVSVNSHKVLKLNGLVSVQQVNSEFPMNYKLEQNYPNPFNPVTKIRYELPQQSFVEFKVFDMLGKVVAVYINRMQNEGTYEILFDGKLLASGVYFYQLKTNGFTDTKKMLLIK
ncbi:MAG: T9SS type A sorting domain-containing protein [Bacteroidetes bacterium]|nr:T9SS type A sorting domain-containing protein [Bacteroidota bacterium]